MPLDTANTTLAASPYFDDFAENAEPSNYHRILFKPSVAVQARELTQLQTILQNQIERFGDNIYRRGTILSGCNMIYDANYSYVKIEDTQVDGISVVTSEFANTLVEDARGLQAVVVNNVDGFVSLNPNLNTLYVKYINVGTASNSDGSVSDVKVFAANSILTSYHRRRRVERIVVTQGGVGYSNDDVIVFTANNDSGVGAQATIVTDAVGTIQRINMVSRGAGYINPPEINISTTTGISAQISAINYVGKVIIASAAYDSVGVGYAVTTSDGYIYQKGHFVRVEPQTLIVSKYASINQGQPNDVVVGFQTNEAVATYVTDTTLLDNATGAPNENAPGADRLQLTPELIYYETENTINDPNFLSLIEFQNGVPVQTNLNTMFNSIDKEQSRRTFEESGDYVVNEFSVYGEEKRDLVEGTTNTYISNTTHLNAVVTPGIAYINGMRVQTINNRRLSVRKGTDTDIINNQGISTGFGSFVYVNELIGNFNPLSSQTVTLYGGGVGLKAASGVTTGSTSLVGIPSMPATSIGTAKIRGLEYDSGTPGTPQCQYRMYLYDVKMAAGRTFSDTFVVGITSTAVADVVRSSGRAILQDVGKDGVIFPIGANATKQLSDMSLVHRAQTTGVSFALSGNADLTISTTGASFPYTSGTTLSQTDEQDFIIIPSVSFEFTTAASGNTGITSGSNAIVGTSSSFTSDFRVGDTIVVKSGATSYYNRITGIASDISMTCANTFPATNATAKGHLVFPAQQPVSLVNRSNALVEITSPTTARISLGAAINVAATSTTVVYNSKIDSPKIKTKRSRRDIFVKISAAAVATSPIGPWCLGIPDVHKITGVYLGTGATYATAATATNYVNQFELFNGQTDNLYGLAYIRRGPNATVDIGSTTNILVKMDVYYDHGSVTDGAFFAGAASYPIDDINREANTAAITTEEIEVFVSPRTGVRYDLRDSIDFRPVVANTADSNATSAASATIDPATTETISVLPQFFASPSESLSADVEYYLPRLDVISITPTMLVPGLGGAFTVSEGLPNLSPSVPRIPDTAMSLATIVVPPYPSLDPLNAKQANRSDLAVRVTQNSQQKRYTMKDIGGIEKRINRLEYYSLLNRMESSAKDLAANRTLNGFLTDSFDDFDMTNVNDTEFNAFVDVAAGELRTRVYAETIDLGPDTTSSSQSSNVDVSNQDQVLLPYTETRLLAQPFASNIRNIAGEFWKFKGNLFIYPKYDGQYDRDIAPANITIDLSSSQKNIVDAINSAFLQMDGRTTVTGETSEALADTIDRNSSTTGFITSTSTTTTSRARITTTGIIEKSQLTTGEAATTQQGAFNAIVKSEFKPFMRAQPITFFATGLRPNARHYVFFDRVDVNRHVIPGSYIAGTTTISEASVVPTGSLGAELRADDQGKVAGIFLLPEGTFYVGERELLIVDVVNLASSEAAISVARAQYNAYNINIDQQQVTISTKSIESYGTNMVTTFNGTLSTRVQVTGVTNETIVTDNTPAPAPFIDTGGGDGGGGGDPLAQTFLVPDDIQNSTDGVYVSAIDVYFQSTTTRRGVTLEIRDVVNGYPGPQTLPFARKWVDGVTMATSATAGTPTRFIFDTPVFVLAGREYCFVLKSDGNDPSFFVWSGKAGEADILNPSITVKTDWGFGQMFTSVNNTAWNPHSFEDVKFTMLRAEFTPNSSGKVSLKPKNYEFITVTDTSGGFLRGEKIAQKASVYNTGDVQTTNTSLTVTGVRTQYTKDINVNDTILVTYGINANATPITGTTNATTTSATVTGTTTDYVTDMAVGDYIQINGNIRQVINVASTTSMTLDAPASNTVAANSVYKFDKIEYDVIKVRQIIDDLTFIGDRVPKYTTNSTVSATYMKVVAAEVDRYRAEEKKLYLKNSTAANDTFKFVKSVYSSLNANTGKVLIAGQSNTVAKIVSIDDLTVNYIDSDLRTMTPTGTGINVTYALGKSGTNALTYFGGTTNGTTRTPFEGLIKSRSNEIAGTTSYPSLNVDINMGTVTRYASPAVDVEPAQIQIIRNIVDNYTSVTKTGTVTSGNANIAFSEVGSLVVGMGCRGKSIPVDATIVSINSTSNQVTLSKTATGTQTGQLFEFHPNEITRYGISKNKYISKYMVLADGMEAEDFKLYLTAYRPTGTDIDVYARFVSEEDGEDLNRKDWTLLTVSERDVYSDPLRPNDYKEYTFTAPKTPPAITLAGRASTSGTTLTGEGTAFTTDLVAGDLIKLVTDDTTVDGVPVYGQTSSYELVSVVGTPASATSLTINKAVTFTSGYIQRVTQPRAAYLDNKSSPQYILTYHGASADGTVTAKYTGYKYVAVKIVLRSAGTSLTPVVRDVRAISLMI